MRARELFAGSIISTSVSPAPVNRVKGHSNQTRQSLIVSAWTTRAAGEEPPKGFYELLQRSDASFPAHFRVFGIPFQRFSLFFFRDLSSRAIENSVFVLICQSSTCPFNYPSSPVVLQLSAGKERGGGEGGGFSPSLLRAPGEV